MNTINWTALGVIIAIVSGVISILNKLGVIKISTAKDRMKRKILKNLNKLTNRECPLLPEIRLRDEVYWDRLGHKPLLEKRFFGLFVESMKELASSDSGEIIYENRNELFYPYPLPFPPYKKEKDPFPPYNSRISKTLSDYFLGEDNPDLYVGRKTQECEAYIESKKRYVAYIAGEAAKTV